MGKLVVETVGTGTAFGVCLGRFTLTLLVIGKIAKSLDPIGLTPSNKPL